MKSLYTGLGLWNVGVLLAFAVLLIVQHTQGLMAPHSFQIAAVFVAVFCCLVHSLLVVHFIGTMKWIQQSGPTAGLDEHQTKPLRRAWIRGAMFPVLVMCMLVAVAVAILSGGSHMGSISPWIPATLAVLAIPLNVLAIPLARNELDRTTTRMNGLEQQMVRRVHAGLVRKEDDDALIPESGRAGGKVLVFLALNVWILYAYMRFVLRKHDVSWVPYAIGCAVLMGIGIYMLRGHQDPPGNKTTGAGVS